MVSFQPGPLKSKFIFIELRWHYFCGKKANPIRYCLWVAQYTKLFNLH